MRSSVFWGWSTFGLFVGLAAGHERRQSTSEHQCRNETYQTEIGLNFDTFCDSNIAGFDITSTPGTDLEDCMIQCSIGQGPTGEGPCQGVSYEAARSTCWWKDSNATVSRLVPGANIDTAIAHADQFTSLDLACPFEDGSVQKTANGMEDRVYCGLDFYGSDIDAGYHPLHTRSLDECMDFCSKGNPLCMGIAYNPNLQRGYHNCYLKGRSDTSAMRAQPWIMHSTLVELPLPNATCNAGNFTFGNEKIFSTICGYDSGGRGLLDLHTPDLGACMDSCASYVNGTQSCVAAVYNPDATLGFENCYLKSSLGQVYSHTLTHFASVVGNATATGAGTGPSDNATAPPSPADSGDDSSSNSSNAWIAGAVVGPLAGIGLIAGFALWWRQRRRSRAAASPRTHRKEPPRELDGVSRHEVGPQDERLHELPS